MYGMRIWDCSLALIISHHAQGIAVHIDESELCSTIFGGAETPVTCGSPFNWAQAALDKHGYDTTPTRMQALFNRLDKNDVRGKNDKDVLKKLLE
jgi:hypothetical protein